MKSFLKYMISGIMQFCMRILWLVPVQNNQIVLTSYDGSQYACNPKYISEYLSKNYPGNFEIVWLLKHPEQYEFLSSHKIKVEDYKIFNRIRYGLKAKVIIVNTGVLFSLLPLRKSQLHINTWHGGGFYKLSGVDETRTNNFDKRRIVLSSKNTSYFLSTNQCFTDGEIRPAFGYDGEVLSIGFPRNDIFFQSDDSEIHRKVCTYFSIKEDCRILLYAPTCRYSDNTNFVFPDFEKLKASVERRFGGNWVILTRMHYDSKFKTNMRNIYDANYRPDMPDMQELLASSDMLVSDYSSCIWDYSFTYRPCLLFTPDLDEYTENRGFGIDIHDWGFPVCKTEQELWNSIENFDEDDFRGKMEKHHDNLGSFEHGNATEIMGKLIYNFCYPEKKNS